MDMKNLEAKFQERNPHKIEPTYHLPLGGGLQRDVHFNTYLSPRSLAQHFALIETSRKMFVTAILAQGFFWLL